MKTVILTILVLVVLSIAGGLLFIQSGIYSVAADYPDSKPISWVLTTTSDRSIEHHATGEPTIDLEKPANVRAGAKLFHKVCAQCHVAPGQTQSDIAKGLNPEPPELGEAAEWPPAQAFWVIKHGIRMTGMPSAGKTHTDDQVWQIVAFVRKMPKVTEPQYVQMVKGPQ